MCGPVRVCEVLLDVCVYVYVRACMCVCVCVWGNIKTVKMAYSHTQVHTCTTVYSYLIPNVYLL